MICYGKDTLTEMAKKAQSAKEAYTPEMAKKAQSAKENN